MALSAVKLEDISEYARVNIDRIVRGQPLNLDNIDDWESFKMCSLSCIINGPVGVGKENAFPELFEGSIRSKFGCRTSQWRETCRIIASSLDESLKPKSLHCRLYGNYWPLAEKRYD